MALFCCGTRRRADAAQERLSCPAQSNSLRLPSCWGRLGADWTPTQGLLGALGSFPRLPQSCATFVLGAQHQLFQVPSCGAGFGRCSSAPSRNGGFRPFGWMSKELSLHSSELPHVVRGSPLHLLQGLGLEHPVLPAGQGWCECEGGWQPRELTGWLRGNILSCLAFLSPAQLRS